MDQLPVPAHGPQSRWCDAAGCAHLLVTRVLVVVKLWPCAPASSAPSTSSRQHRHPAASHDKCTGEQASAEHGLRASAVHPCSPVPSKRCAAGCCIIVSSYCLGQCYAQMDPRCWNSHMQHHAGKLGSSSWHWRASTAGRCAINNSPGLPAALMSCSLGCTIDSVGRRCPCSVAAAAALC